MTLLHQAAQKAVEAPAVLEVGFKYANGVHTPTLLLAFRGWDERDAFVSAFQQQPEPVAAGQRQRFEAWADDQGFPLRKLETSDGYLDLRTQGAWDAWQACVAIQHQEEPREPIDMLLFCPDCGEQHIDAPELGGVDLDSPGGLWLNPPHKSHLCHGCGCIWRPADVPTNGVACGITRGKADTWLLGDGAIPAAPASLEALIIACYNDAAHFPEAEDPRTSDWVYDDNHLCAEAIRERGKETARHYVERLAASPSPQDFTLPMVEEGKGVPEVAPHPDTVLLDFIASEYLDVSAFAMPTGADDADVGWKLHQEHMGAKGRVEVARHYRDDLRAAIRAAMQALGHTVPSGVPACGRCGNPYSGMCDGQGSFCKPTPGVPVGINGLTEAETSATASVMGIVGVPGTSGGQQK